MASKAVHIFILFFTIASTALSFTKGGSRQMHESMMQELEFLENSCDYGICEDTLSYPEETIADLIEDTKSLHSYFGHIISPKIDLFNRDGVDKEQYKQLCGNKIVILRPRLLRDVEGKIRYTANIGESYQQTIAIEVCQDLGKPCVDEANLPDNYQTECKQKYNIIKFLSLTENRTALEYAKFSIPSTCMCSYRQNYF